MVSGNGVKIQTSSKMRNLEKQLLNEVQYENDVSARPFVLGSRRAPASGLGWCRSFLRSTAASLLDARAYPSGHWV